MRAWFALALLLPLAGCSGPASGPAPAETGPSVITAPGESLNDTGAHIHDYWRGGDRLVVIDAVHQGGDEPGTGPGVANGQDIEVRQFVPGAGSVVPQGTSALEVTFTWMPDELDSWTAPRLFVKTAAQDAAVVIGDLESGVPLQFNITADDADLPHQVLSAYEFELRMSSPDPMPLRFKGAVGIVVEAIRGLPLPVFPAHPDRWNGSNEIALVDAAGQLSYWEDTRDGGCNGASCPQVFRPAPGAIVPANATSVRVTVTVSGPAPVRVELHYHNALVREFQKVGALSSESTWEIPLEGGGDGPYAKQSQWEFTIVPEPTGPLRTAWLADYTITAVAVR